MTTLRAAGLVRPSYLRAVRLAFRPIPDAGGDCDREVLDLVEEPFVSPVDARERMAALERLFRKRGDHRSVFLTVYERVTGEIAANLNVFEDSSWVADYLVEFADLYRTALQGFESGDGGVPDAWKLAFSVAIKDNALLVQHALLGMNAHIVRDLAFALDKIGIDENRKSRYRDHVAVSSVLERVIEDVQNLLATVYAPGLADLDSSLGGLDERVAFFSVHESRLYAWRAAVALAETWGPVRAAVEWLVNATATGAGQFVLGPGMDPATAARIRSLEGEDASDGWTP